ncbi:hypothetical protein BGZ75_010223 [Mortierella antarctica]|nr:hypothetical protein BGZ75_010223 [Mortierella antarctica]
MAIMVGLSLLGFILEAWPRGSTNLQRSSNASTAQKSNLFSRATFHFYQPTISLSRKKTLTLEDTANLVPEDMKTHSSYARLEYYWNQELQAAHSKSKSRIGKTHDTESTAPSLFKTILRVQLGRLPTLIISRIARVLTNYAVPALLSLLLAYFQDIQEPNRTTEPPQYGSVQDITIDNSGYTKRVSVFYGLFLVGAMILAGFLHAIFLVHSRQYCVDVGLSTRSALVSMIYRKALRLSPGARQASTVGSIMNHMSVDADAWIEGFIFLTMWISIPAEIGIGLWLGWSVWVGLLMMISMTPLQIWRARTFGGLQKEKWGFMDERIRLTTEVLSAIKIVKLYCWERAFLQNILAVRNMELDTLRRIGFISAILSIVNTSSTLIVCFVTLSIYATWGGPGYTPAELTPQAVFVSMTLFAMLKTPISSSTEALTQTVNVIISTRRIQTFLLQEEVDLDAIIRVKNVDDQHQNEPLVVIKNGTFSWTCDHDLADDETVGLLDSFDSAASKPTLQNIDLSVPNGSLVAIVGRQAWILNATLRDNILFGNAMDHDRYHQVLFACGLEPDIEMLPAGDLSEIGERGINLSGGQKQRVSLARAVYGDADVYLLDDPLSAVDAHVDQHLWTNVIGPDGMLKHKARLLVTHGIHHLQDVDKLVLLKDGQVVETGTYQQLMDAKQTFCQLIIEHSVASGSQMGNPGTNRRGMPLSKDASDSEADSQNSAESTATAKTGKRHLWKRKDKEKDTKGRMIEAEQTGDKDLSRDVIMAYLAAISFKLAALVVGLHVVAQICLVSPSLWLKYWIGLNDSNHRPPLSVFLAVFALLTMAYVILNIVLLWITFAIARIRAAERLHRKLMERVMRLPQAFFDTTPLGRIINRVSSDMNSIDDRVPAKIHDLANQTVTLLSSLIIVVFTAPAFLLALPIILLAYYIIQQYYLSASQPCKRLFQVTKSPLFQHFQETLGGVSTIRAMGVQDRFVQFNALKADVHTNQFLAFGYCIRWMEIQTQLVGLSITLSASLWFVLSPQGSVDAATAGLALSFTFSISSALIWFTRSYCDLFVHMISVERVQEYTKMNTEAPLLTTPDSPAQGALQEEQWPKRGRIAFVNYSTRYREGLDLVLKNMSFSVEAGEKIGIVGRTGAGKSSMTLALFRMIEAANSYWAKASDNSGRLLESPRDASESPEEDGGRIEIDGIDISTLGLQDLRQHLAIIPQDPVLFAGSVRENLDPFNELADTALWEALERSHLKDFISSLPGGLSFQVAQHGENFSVGQRSLICLARALLRTTKILVLDEATSAVDVETDELIQKTIRREFSNLTVLTIAHRIKTVMDSDRILVLDQGMVVEYDSPRSQQHLPLLDHQNNPTDTLRSFANTAFGYFDKYHQPKATQLLEPQKMKVLAAMMAPPEQIQAILQCCFLVFNASYLAFAVETAFSTHGA